MEGVAGRKDGDERLQHACGQLVPRHGTEEGQQVENESRQVLVSLAVPGLQKQHPLLQLKVAVSSPLLSLNVPAGQGKQSGCANSFAAPAASVLK